MSTKFNSFDFRSGEENRLKNEYFDMNMNPREWMAKFGHNIVCGDMRIYKYTDKIFEKWIYKAFESLTCEGLEKLWQEFLTENEIIEIRKKLENF